MKKNEGKTMLDSIPSSFYDSTLTTQGRVGEHKRCPMDFYTGNLDEKSPAVVAKGFPGDYYKTAKN